MTDPAAERTEMTQAPPPAPEQTPDETSRPRRSRGRKALRGVGAGCLVVSLCVLAVLVGLLLTRGRTMDVPPWVEARIEQKINAGLLGAHVEIAGLDLVVTDDWQPRFHLRDLRLRDRAGAEVLLSDVESTLALRPLLQGRLAPYGIYVNGAMLRLRRNAEGRFDLDIGGDGRSTDLAQTMQTLEDLLAAPAFADMGRIEARALTLTYEDVPSNRTWTVDGGRILLQRRDADLSLRGDFALLSGQDYATTLGISYDTRIGEGGARLAVQLDEMPAADIATQSPALAWLAGVRAPISGALRVTIDERGRLGPLVGTLQAGQGVIQPTDTVSPIPFDSAVSYFRYDPGARRLRFDELSVQSPWLSAQAEGELRLLGDNLLQPSTMTGQLSLSSFVANPADLYPAPVSLDAAKLDIRLALDPFEVTLGDLSLVHREDTLRLSGWARARPEGWDVSVSGGMGHLTPGDLLSFWPAGVKPKTREWIEKNIASGQMQDLQLGLRSKPQQKPEVSLGFNFAGLTATFMKHMPPITNGMGHATLQDNRFVVVAEGGEVRAPQGGVVGVRGTSFIIPDVRIKGGPAEVRLQTDSTITAALALLDREPLNVMQKAGKPVTLADGRVKLEGRLNFPLKKGTPPSEVHYDVSGQMANLRSEEIVPGRVLTASALWMTANNTALTITGTARLGDVPVGGTWRAEMGDDAGGRSRLEGWVELSDRFADEFRIGLPPNTFSGRGRGDVEIDLAKGQPAQFRLTSDLAGLGLRVDSLGWSLSEGGTGQLAVAGRLGAPPQVDSLTLQAPGLTAEGSLRLGADGQLAGGTFNRVAVGDWLRGTVELQGRGAGRKPLVLVTSGTLDMRRLPTGMGSGGAGGGQGGDSTPVSLALQEMRISDAIALTDFRGNFTTRGGMQGSFEGRMNGGAAVAGEVVPQGGRSAIRLTAQDAGRVMAAAGLMKQGHGGQMTLTLRPVSEAGSYDGDLQIKDLWIRDAPAMAELLNAISVVGLLEQLSGDGILFSDVEGKFRLTPDQVIVTESSATGASIGLSLDGYYGLKSRRIDMQGVVSPFYLVNGVGSLLTRKGEGLIGFNYTLKGTADAPQVSVNPLSLLTPGMFREIFRRPAPKVSQ
ncbi:DUF3971 domain-containing protein [Maritimibacter alkaliphilus]|uniref:YhdP family protein n=1 Tax=Maritimibacter alkaliphilus TaxID=404236 RepID=UPI001C96E87F|nr:AsmA-like C-terminal region-containing protein [Maritimibacter alkaliphilus]MBY6089144.1 hypothetical protein [Maritimibacter alkaliphilus]